MNNAVYALPGFMPPSAPNWKRNIVTNEDGSIKLCVYCGLEGAKVYYCLDIPGWRFGFIKDPKYFEDNDYPEHVLDRVREYSQYLSSTDTLEADVVVPKRIINDWPIPITENHIQDKRYWILTIPSYILPVGDTKVQVDANGIVASYVIQRPQFDIHRRRDVTDKKIYK